MQNRISNLRKILILVLIAEALLLVFFRVGLEKGIMTATIILLIQAVLFFYVLDRIEYYVQEQSTGIREILGSAEAEAFDYGEIGMLTYDDDYVITWMSDLFAERGIDRIGYKVLSWLPEADPLISGIAETTEVTLDERTYAIYRKQDEPVLIFRDVTEARNAIKLYEDIRTVVGIAVLDNYEESTQYEDDSTVSNINAAVRTPLTEYCRSRGILLKRISNSRYYMILNERIFGELYADRFSILNEIRKQAQKQDVSITLSMSFARGTDRLQDLDEMAVRLMEIAQNRGGDQVVVQKAGEDVRYFGGSSEAAEKRSRVRVRVMAHTLRDLISRSSNVIVCGHRNMDFDCLGAAIGIARVAQGLHKQTCIIEKTGGVEEKLLAVVEANLGELNEEVHFVTENEALNQLQPNTLVIMVDHHNVKQSNGSKVLESARKVAIIDHHRRTADMGVKPVFVYIEAGASSACELITELFPYITPRLEISELDANIMLAGMMIDTNRFHVRTGARTFEAASSLRQMGADPMQVDDFLKDTYDEFNLKAQCMALSKRYDRGVITVPYTKSSLSRSMMSQVADRLLSIQDVEAVFVIANDTDGETAISARSAGNINVQVIMESMNGGGHMTAAAMQRKRCNIEDLEKELLEKIDAYFKEVEHEGHSEK